MFTYEIEEDKIIRKDKNGKLYGFIDLNKPDNICRYLTDLDKMLWDERAFFEKETKELKDKIESIRKIANK